MSIPRVEKTKGDYYMYREVFTPSVWRILEALDNEKMDVMEKLGCERIPYVEVCKYRNSLDESRDAKEIFFSYANLPNPLKGPTEVDSRFISEMCRKAWFFWNHWDRNVRCRLPFARH